LIDKATNVHIFGRGTIDGSGSVVRAQGKPANLIRIRRSKNIVVEGIILRDPAAWNTHIQFSENVRLRNLKLLNDADVPNTDGFDPDASRKVLIDHCFAYCKDDNIAIKTTNNLNLNQDVDSVTVKNCVFLTKKSSLKIGTETRCNSIRKIVFENNDIIQSDRAMAIDVQDKAIVDDVLFRNIRIEHSYPDAQQRGININLTKRNSSQNSVGKIQNVRFEDCSFEEAFPNGFRIYRDTKNTLPSDVDVTFRHVTVEGTEVNSLSDVYFDKKTNCEVKFLK
jgi:polygalacturonase